MSDALGNRPFLTTGWQATTRKTQVFEAQNRVMSISSYGERSERKESLLLIASH